MSVLQVLSADRQWCPSQAGKSLVPVPVIHSQWHGVHHLSQQRQEYCAVSSACCAHLLLLLNATCLHQLCASSYGMRD